MCKVAHDCQQACRVECIGSVVDERVHIAQAPAWPPCFHVVVAPEKSIDDGLKIANFNRQDEQCGSEFTVIVEDAHGHQTDQVAYQGEEHTQSEIGDKARR